MTTAIKYSKRGIMTLIIMSFIAMILQMAACIPNTNALNADRGHIVYAKKTDNNKKKSTTEKETSEKDNSSSDPLSDISISMSAENGKNGSLSISGVSGDASQTWTTIFAKYKTVIVGISGIALLTFLLFFIFFLMKVAQSSTNPSARGNAITGCIVTGICAACCGAATVFIGIFWNALN